MRKTVATVALLAVLFGGLAYTRAVADETQDEKFVELGSVEPVSTRVYRTQGLPVYDKSGKWKPTMLMDLIQASVAPNDWEPRGGMSTMVSYAKSESIIISTNKKNHDTIVELLERFRNHDEASISFHQLRVAYKTEAERKVAYNQISRKGRGAFMDRQLTTDAGWEQIELKSVSDIQSPVVRSAVTSLKFGVMSEIIDDGEALYILRVSKW